MPNYLKLPPELVDGQNYEICYECDSTRIVDWLLEADPGDSITISVVGMTEEEFDALPEL